MTASLVDELPVPVRTERSVTTPEAPAAPRLRPAPPTDVPYDAEPEDQSRPGRAPRPPVPSVTAVPTLPGLDRTLWPETGPVPGPPARQLSLVGAPTRGATAPPTGGPSAAGPRAVVLVRALLEVVAGVRPVGQLRGSVTPTLALELEERRHTGPARRPATLVSVRLSEPDTGVAEVSAVVRRPGPAGRCGAVALRMEQRQGRWVVCRLVMG